MCLGTLLYLERINGLSTDDRGSFAKKKNDVFDDLIDVHRSETKEVVTENSLQREPDLSKPVGVCDDRDSRVVNSLLIVRFGDSLKSQKSL